MNETTKELLEIHKLVSVELRHTATVVWQFAIAIATLQGGAVGLSAQSGFQSTFGKFVLAAGFGLSVCFSLMLIRQAKERGYFVERIKAVEEELRIVYPKFFVEIKSPFKWFTSVFLAWIVFLESVGFLIVFLFHLFHWCCPLTR